MGIIGTALGAWALFGRRGFGGGLGAGLGTGGGGSYPANVNINGVDAMNGSGSSCSGPSAWETWKKECEDTVALQKGLYDWAMTQQNQRFQDRQTIDQEMFGIYKTTRDGFDILTGKQNDIAFQLYKGSRDQYDDLAKQISDLKSHVAINDAVRPYQDKLIQCEINNVKTLGAFEDERILNYINKLDCRNIKGVLCLPDDRTISGVPSNNPCCCGSYYGESRANTPTKES